MSDTPLTEVPSTVEAAAAPLPVLPLRDVVVYPHMVIPLFVGREKSILALDQAMRADKQIVLVAQKQADVDDPKADDLYEIGTLATILQLLKLPDGTVKVLVEGGARARVDRLVSAEFFSAAVTALPDLEGYDEREIDVLVRSVITQFEQYVKMNKKVPPEILTSLAGIEQPGRLADTVAAHMALKLSEKQKVLEITEVRRRIEHVLALIEGEMEVLQIEKRIRGRVKQQMEKSQREYYLNEQMKAIQREMGDLEDAPNELGDLEKRIRKAGMSKEARDKALAELGKLKLMSPMSAEATVVRNYLDWLVKAPWKKRTKVRHDIAAAQTVLDADHYGLDKVKERIVEYLAVQQRVKNLRGPILCLVGPPGVGKTSLGQSIAKALGRKFVRVSLGGVHDEAEIRGHRRTYIGALPGNIIQALKKAGTRGCVIMLDEIDKLGTGVHGDPSSALLEVLDPEQNNTFRDNYLAVPYDLSQVLFIATANLLDPVAGPLRDRMEVLHLAGYTQEEKAEIARRYLVARQLDECGLTPAQLDITDKAIATIIRDYTREAGVRNLERQIGAVCRRVAVRIAQGQAESVRVDAPDVVEILGPAKFENEVALRTGMPGVATGLAWTPVGGDILFIEASRTAGSGRLILTGQLGDVMKESAQAALTLVKSRAADFQLDPAEFEKTDVHIHVPAGAIPKDGPSAGVAMFIALASLFSNRPVRSDVAMTGEISLRGLVLPIGGVKEKVLAALAAGIKKVMLPARNRKDLDEVPQAAREHLEFVFMETVEEAAKAAIESVPVCA